jgi:hypothetical protein
MFLLIVPDANNNEFSSETRLEGPDHQVYVVRVAAAGVPRYNMWDTFYALVAGALWGARRRKRWSAQVFTVGRVAVEEPPVLNETFDSREVAEVRASEVIRQITDGDVGWDHWHIRHTKDDPEASA